MLERQVLVLEHEIDGSCQAAKVGFQIRLTAKIDHHGQRVYEIASQRPIGCSIPVGKRDAHGELFLTPAACMPEAAHGGKLARLRDGDVVVLDAEQGSLTVELDDEELTAREPAVLATGADNLGRNLFRLFRASNTGALDGASVFAQSFPRTG